MLIVYYRIWYLS